MPVYEDSRYVSATEITEVTLDEITGEAKDPVTYLATNRRRFKPEDFTGNIIYTPERGETPDMVTNRFYNRPDLAWIVGEFNPSIGFDMLRTFDGIEQIELPSPENLFTLILNAEPDDDRFL